jgi:hypothetical protein
MSLVKLWWLALGGAGIVAVGAPLKLLKDQQAAVAPLLDDGPAPRIDVRPVASFDAALAKPVFSPNRAPQGAGDPTAAIAAGLAPTVETPPPPLQPLPRLVGIVIAHPGRALVLVKSANGETLTLHPGESADGWRLVGIFRNGATFRNGSEEKQAGFDLTNRTGTSLAPPAIPLPPPLGASPIASPAGLPPSGFADPTGIR